MNPSILHRFLVSALAVLLLASTAEGKDSDPWRPDLSAARAEALKAGKPLIVYIEDSD